MNGSRTMSELIYVHVYDGWFRKSDRAHANYTFCSTDDCEMRKRGKCGKAACPHGSMQRFAGPTRRAKSFGEFVGRHKKAAKGLPPVKDAAEDDAFVLCGEWYYVPFVHLNLDKDSGKPGRTSLFGGNFAYVHKDNMTPEWVIACYDHVPRAIIENAPIKHYLDNSRPKLLAAVRERLPALWAAVVEQRPDIAEYTDNHAPPSSLDIPASQIPRRGMTPARWQEYHGKVYVNYGGHPIFECITELHGRKAEAEIELLSDDIVSVLDVDLILELRKQNG